MKRIKRFTVPMLLATTLVGISFQRSRSTPDQSQAREGKEEAKPADRPYGLRTRTPWTTSKLTGSPEPPPPYRIERAFPRLTFRKPLLLARAPGISRLFVGEEEGKILSFPIDPNADKAELFLDLPAELHSWDRNANIQGIEALYGLAFHPQFEKNRYCYICYVLRGKNRGEGLPEGTRVSRFRVSATEPPRCDPKSEKVLITWLGGGHNGGDLHFGPDGHLYISTGDATNPNPPDRLDTGQDVSDLLASILRIDVDREDPGKAYAIPPDNPFVNMPGVRSEIWAFGFRNPWRMSFDRVTGDLWVGDVGWELWEMVYRIRRGGNYGWSVMEGRQPVRPESRRGPTPILPPTIDFPHTEAASITGGYVYRGKRLKDLVGAYICGDWVTHKLWGTRLDGDRITWHKELAHGTQRIVAFGEDEEGELYFLDYQDVGTLHRLVPTDPGLDTSMNFPRKLSQTGLFSFQEEPARVEPAQGVVPFSINAEHWADHASAERFVALPGDSSIRMYDRPIPIPGGFFSGQVFLPKDGVLAKTLFLEMERGNPASRCRLETQVLHYDGSVWQGYTYAWNEEQTEATLVPAAGMERKLTVLDHTAPGGKRQQTWRYHSRTECLLCHNPWSGYTLAFTEAQLDRSHTYGTVVDQQLRTLEHIGIVSLERAKEPGGRLWTGPSASRLREPHDAGAGLDDRARSYLHVNCAHCHRFGAGGTADIDLRHEVALDRTKTLEVRPVQGTFEIPAAHILSPGDPYRSVLYYRMAKLGPGRMPHLGSEIVDERGLRLIHDWIRQLPPNKDDWLLIEKLRALDEDAILARERDETGAEVERIAREIARAEGRETISGEDRQKAREQQRSRATARAQTRTAERTEIIGKLLSSTPSALMLVAELDSRRIPDSVRLQLLNAALARPEARVRDLFERFVPDEQRVKRLGSVIKPEQILSLSGDAARGKELFFRGGGLQCANCHRVGETGSTLGPDLTQIARKYTRTQLVESLLEPSKTIEPKYTLYLVETTEGQVHTGLLAEKTPQAVVLKNAGDKEVRIPASKVETLVPQPKSLMPDLLLRDLSAEQAADLLEFLVTLK
jgi:putative heme-binding domain-containing protein